MKNYLILFLLSIPVFGFTQNKKYSIEGTTMYMSQYQGGAENPYEPQPYPKGGVALFVVKLETGKKPKQVGEVVSKSDGTFKLRLPSGEYGFVLKEDLESLTVGQFLPTGYSSGDIMESKSSTWSINNNGPVEVMDTDVKGIVVTNFERTVCGMCP